MKIINYVDKGLRRTGPKYARRTPEKHFTHAKNATRITPESHRKKTEQEKENSLSEQARTTSRSFREFSGSA